MGKFGAVALSLEAIPLGGLVGITQDRWLRRRPRFWVRFARFVLCVTLPELLFAGLAAAGLVGKQAAAVLLFGGFAWGVLLVPVAMLLFFEDPGSSPGP